MLVSGSFGWLAMSMNRGNISNGANISDVTHKSSSEGFDIVTIFLRALVAGPLLIFEGYKNIIKDNEIIENGNVNSITIEDFLFLLLIVFQFIYGLTDILQAFVSDCCENNTHSGASDGTGSYDESIAGTSHGQTHKET